MNDIIYLYGGYWQRWIMVIATLTLIMLII